MDFGRPGRLNISVDLGIEALNQLTSQSRPFLWRELERRVQQLSRSHTKEITTGLRRRVLWLTSSRPTGISQPTLRGSQDNAKRTTPKVSGKC